MEPTDQPPPTPQTWAETSAWAPAAEPTAAAGWPPAPAVWNPPPPAVHEPPAADDFVRAGMTPGIVSARRARRGSPARFVALIAVLTEVVVVAAGCNQWVGEKVDTWIAPAPDSLLQRFGLATQSYGWRVGAGSDGSTDGWVASLVRLGVLFVLTGLLVMVVVPRLSPWRAGVAGALTVVFATQVAQTVSSYVFGEIGVPRRYVDYLPISGNNGILYGDDGGFGPQQHSVSDAIFGPAGPSGYSFVASLLLGLLVGLAVGWAAARVREPAPLPAARAIPSAPAPQGFFPPGQLQRPAPGFPAPDAPRSADDLDPPGRHSRG